MCAQECANVGICGSGLRGKRFEGSGLHSKMIVRLQATKRWSSGFRGKDFRARRSKKEMIFFVLRLNTNQVFSQVFLNSTENRHSSGHR